MTERKGENSNTDVTRGLLEQARAALAMGFMSRSHEAFSRQKIEQAQVLVKKILAQDPEHKEARSLLKEIERASGATTREEQKQRTPYPEKPSAAAHNSEPSAVGPEPTLIVQDSGKGKKILGWAGLAALLLGVSFGAFYLMQQGSKREPRPPLDVASQIAVAKSSLTQRRHDQAIEIAQAILLVSPGHSEAQAILSEAQKQKQQAKIEILMVEAQNLRSQNRLEDANQTIQTILDMDPANQAALAVRSQIEAETAASKSNEEQDREIQLWLANADTFLTAGKLPEARREIRKIERLRPDAFQLETLRKRLNALTAGAAREQQKEQQAAGQKQKAIGDLSSRAEELFRQGKYAEAQGIIEQWLAAAPRGTDAQSLQARTLEALAALKTYEVCLAAKDYDGALGAVLRLEKGNPSDPNIAELRRRAELRNADAKATLSVYRLGDPGVLILDGQQLGTGGEVEKKAIKAGRHKIEVRGSNGKQASREIVFLDGQDLTMVYDLTTADLRPMTASDRDAISRRRQTEEIHRFPVEHLHGFLKGKCTGELLISGAGVEYKSKERQHDFSLPLRNLNLTVKDEKLDFAQSSGDDRYQFRARDPVQASTIKNLWKDLQRTGK